MPQLQLHYTREGDAEIICKTCFYKYLKDTWPPYLRGPERLSKGPDFPLPLSGDGARGSKEPPPVLMKRKMYKNYFGSRAVFTGKRSPRFAAPNYYSCVFLTSFHAFSL